uniref:dihydrofolate reductase n=43 Tax=Pseudomonadati TaxID=3379134 RepID=Q9EXQ6_CAMJU|nr:trimethoprim-resistant repeat-containing dihydrofolate reductase DfrA1 [Campylobacter jejuni]CAC19929.1 dihydrofolate reductase [Campylobacter jejuni]
MKLSLMVAISKNGVIGNGPDIPWSAKGEQLLFKAITYNQWLLVGRKTFESMGALPNRKYAVVTRSSFTSDNENVLIFPSIKDALPNRKYAVVTRSSFTSDNENVLIFPSIKDALTNLKKITDHVIVSGGGEIYKSLIDQVDTLHISTIDIEPEGDVYFPEIPSNFRPVFTQDFASNINYSYQIWQKG